MINKNNVRFVQGNEACAQAGILAGARFFAGYPITPASEIAEISSVLLPQRGGIYLQMEDEIASIAAVIGASLAGMKAFTATSGPGLSLMQENIGFAIMAEVPCVIINAQRFGPSTGVATKPSQSDIMACRWGTSGDHSIIVLAPASVQECFDLTIEAFNLAETLRTPVILLTDAILAHLSEKIIIPDEKDLNIINRKKPDKPAQKYRPYAPGPDGVPVLSAFGDEHILRVTGLVHDFDGYSTASPQIANELIQRLHNKIENAIDIMPQPKIYGSNNPDVLVISFGISARASRLAVNQANKQGMATRFIQLTTIWPFPEKIIQEECSGVKTVL
ncbi:MAG: 2-oxoacid:acceptor oxidoreductase subunit alpha, partial [Halanaerobiaceae bacterium]|nr:2-oxoacid:acceptor oxidoreductase subunit alpha [Halanaerobiaceae bacterium]